jgi:hypothetical protein
MARRASVAKRREWARRMERFRRSGRTVAAFCEAEAVSLASFYHWRRKLREHVEASVEPVSPRLKPVQLSAGGPAAPAITVRLAGGVAIEVAPDSRVLSEVLDQVLAQHAVWQRAAAASDTPSC